MNIRGHHLLCMRYFKGKGYNKRFVNNFSRVIKRLKKNPPIRIVNYPDDICSCCPHNLGNRCSKKGKDSEEKVKKKDDIIIKYLGLKSNQRARIKNVMNIVSLRLNKLRRICRECEWKEYCKD